MLTPATVPELPRIDLHSISKAGGAWRVDWVRARADAAAILNRIDFSKRDIVLWVPGPDAATEGSTFAAAVADSYSDGSSVSFTNMQYESSWDLRRSVPTGIATLRLVLQEIGRRGGHHRVLLAGADQGAWVIGEAIADPSVGAIVERAVLVGHPWLAGHQYADGQDRRVRVVNRAGDALTQPTSDPTAMLDALVDLHGTRIDGPWGTSGTTPQSILATLLRDPELGVQLLRDMARRIPIVHDYVRDPSDYSDEMTRAVEYLRTGS